LSFVTVRSAGHAVPKDQGANSVEMLRRFVELSPSSQQFCDGSYPGCVPRASVGPALCSVLQNCSGHGACNNDTGSCICDAGWTNADCGVPIQVIPALGKTVTASTSAYEWSVFEISIVDGANYNIALYAPPQTDLATANLTFSLFLDANAVGSPLFYRRQSTIALSPDAFTHSDRGTADFSQMRSITAYMPPGKYRIGVWASVHANSTILSCTTPASYTLTVAFSSDTGAPVAPDYNDHRGSIVIIVILAVISGVSTLSTAILAFKISRDSKKDYDAL
jgi:hypothetical protein